MSKRLDGKDRVRVTGGGLIGARLTAARVARGLAQKTLADRIEAYPSVLSRLERNADSEKTVTDRVLKRICVHTPVSADYLLGLSSLMDTSEQVRTRVVEQVVAILKRRGIEMKADYLLGALDAMDAKK